MASQTLMLPMAPVMQQALLHGQLAGNHYSLLQRVHPRYPYFPVSTASSLKVIQCMTRRDYDEASKVAKDFNPSEIEGTYDADEHKHANTLENIDDCGQEINGKLMPDFFMRWNVPWDGKTVVVTLASFGVSFILTGLSVSIGIHFFGKRREFMDLDDQVLLIFSNQLLQTIVGISVINACIRNYKPLPEDFFKYDWKDPFDVNHGWLLWGLIGFIGGAGSILFAGFLTSALNGQPLQREEQDALLQLLPFIGTSKIRTALLLGVTGALAPYLEETVFRGFLMASLSKWMPMPLAVIFSSVAFALAHFTPAEIPQLFALGLVLGFTYAKSRNLLTPIMIHAMWNSGVVLLLTFLRMQGYDIQEII